MVCVLLQIKLADFGFARHFTEEGTKKPVDMSSLAGTPVFMVSARPAALNAISGREYAMPGCMACVRSLATCAVVLVPVWMILVYLWCVGGGGGGGGGGHVTWHDQQLLAVWFQL